MSLSRVIQRRPFAHDGFRRKAVPWIASPLQPSTKASREYTVTPGEDPKTAKRTNDPSLSERSSLADNELPRFRYHHESSTIELFYDLFLVANLTSFTADHEIINGQSLRNYVGFFTIVWFTWLETSLFDVRFATESVFTRICKAIAFAAMTGIAACGANYNTGEVSEHLRTFRSLSIILMISRLALAIQYIVVLLYVHKYPRTQAPLLATIAILLLSAIAFLGTFFAFNLNDESNEHNTSGSNSSGPPVYISHYIIVCVETIGVIAISCIWRSISFKKTHLVERIGLITLIIMGEGIIGITKSISKILQNAANTAASVFGITISAVLLLYFVWILYFDQIDHDRFGTIRQQVWAILHFPLHTALILVSEGSATLILWKAIIRYLVEALAIQVQATDMVSSTNAEVAGYIEKQLKTFVHHFKNETLFRLDVESFINSSLTDIRQLPANDSSGRNDTIVGIRDDMFNLVFGAFGIEVNQEDTTWDPQLSIFDTVIFYYYLAAGVFVILLAVLYSFGKTNKSRGEWFSAVLRLVVGIGLCTTTPALVLRSDKSSTRGFVFSAWTVTVVMLVYFVLIILDNLLDWYADKKSSGQKPTYIEDTERSLEGEEDALVKQTNTDMAEQGETIRLRLVEISPADEADPRRVEDPQSSRS
ncbi:hypothetical protein H2204_005794 [Knufia peltigerae]|uniref:Low temperature requirement A n=1 Tax=Knufia peltigerae TaxID=1002370 RepID=A0AA39CYI1_9EURO|nr:hypothetical protein H2204_005794 [Knufia peltigerae]